MISHGRALLLSPIIRHLTLPHSVKATSNITRVETKVMLRLGGGVSINAGLLKITTNLFTNHLYSVIVYVRKITRHNRVGKYGYQEGCASGN